MSCTCASARERVRMYVCPWRVCARSCSRACREIVSATRTSIKHCIIISLPSHRMTPHQNRAISTVIASSAGHRISHTTRIACSAHCKCRFLLACIYVANHKPCCTRNCGPQHKSFSPRPLFKGGHTSTHHTFRSIDLKRLFREVRSRYDFPPLMGL